MDVRTRSHRPRFFCVFAVAEKLTRVPTLYPLYILQSTYSFISVA